MDADVDASVIDADIALDAPACFPVPASAIAGEYRGVFRGTLTKDQKVSEAKGVVLIRIALAKGRLFVAGEIRCSGDLVCEDIELAGHWSCAGVEVKASGKLHDPALPATEIAGPVSWQLGTAAQTLADGTFDLSGAIGSTTSRLTGTFVATPR